MPIPLIFPGLAHFLANPILQVKHRSRHQPAPNSNALDSSLQVVDIRESVVICHASLDGTGWQMKKFLFAIVILMFSSHTAVAESLWPEEVVKSLIQSIQNNDLHKILETADLVKIATHPRHGRTPQNLVSFLKRIDLKRVKFQKTKMESWPEAITVRMVEPLSIDFDLELQKATFQRQEDYYLVVAVHP